MCACAGSLRKIPLPKAVEAFLRIHSCLCQAFLQLIDIQFAASFLACSAALASEPMSVSRCKP